MTPVTSQSVLAVPSSVPGSGVQFLRTPAKAPPPQSRKTKPLQVEVEDQNILPMRTNFGGRHATKVLVRMDLEIH